MTGAKLRLWLWAYDLGMWISLTGDRVCYWLLRHQPSGVYEDLTDEGTRRDLRGGEPW